MLQKSHSYWQKIKLGLKLARSSYECFKYNRNSRSSYYLKLVGHVLLIERVEPHELVALAEDVDRLVQLLSAQCDRVGAKLKRITQVHQLKLLYIFSPTLALNYVSHRWQG